jgi:hypothetical protein
MKISQVDRQKLLPLLDELSKAIEDLLLTGLTTASDSTRQTLNVSFQESSRLGLLRLGGTLRVACEELSRYTRNQSEFSRKRFSFFLNRAWLLSRGLSIALRDGDEEGFERLSWTPASTPLARLEVVTLGVHKKVVPNAFCAFEFRLRTVRTEDSAMPVGQKLVWSSVFPIKAGTEVPAEGYLHLPQKQKFNAYHFIEGKTVLIENAVVTYEKSGVGRISFNDQSTVTQGAKYADWDSHLEWKRAEALSRMQQHQPGPLDLDIELQEEVYLDEWEMGDPDTDSNESQIIFPMTYRDVRFNTVVSRGADGDDLNESLESLRKEKKRSPLYGLMHYERCGLTFQPLSTFGKEGPQHLMLSKKKIDRSALLKALKF